MLARPAPAPVQAAMNLSTLEGQPGVRTSPARSAALHQCNARAQQIRTQERSCRYRGCQARVPRGCVGGFCRDQCISPRGCISPPAPGWDVVQSFASMLSVYYTEAVGGEPPLCCRISARYVHAESESIWNAVAIDAHSTFPVLIARSTAAQMTGVRESREWRTRESQ